MFLSSDDLRSAETRLAQQPTLSEARALGKKTVFLCHSHKDQALVRGLVALLQESGWNIYVDWVDPRMPDKPSKQTASVIKDRIRTLNYFLFLATANAMASRWCPWEIGFADGVKPHESILVLPTRDGMTVHGNEYLDLYRRIEVDQGTLTVYPAAQPSAGVALRTLY